MKRSILAAVTLTAAVALLAPGLAGTAAATATGGGQRFTLVAQDSEGTITPADFGAHPAPNQRATEDAPVYRRGHKVGLAETGLTLTRVTGTDIAGLIECSIELPEGNLYFAGSFHLADLTAGAAVPVVGGTGRFTGARGLVTMTMSAAGDHTTLKFAIDA